MSGASPEPPEKDQQVSHRTLEGWQAGLQSSFDQAAIGMAFVGLDGHWLRINSALRQIVGYSEEDLLATNFQSITHPDDLAADLNYVRQMLRREIRSYQMEKRYFHKKGHALWVLLSVTLVCDADNNPLFFFSQVQDITERKRAEEALREIDERFQAFLNNSPSPIFIKDTEGRYVIVNRRFETALRVRQEDIRGKTDAEVFAPGQAAAFRAHDLQVLRAGASMEFEEVAQHEDGPHTSIVCKFPLLDAEGTVYATGGIATDITQRKLMEEALRRSEARYRELLDNTAYGIYHCAPDGQLLEANPALASMLGYSSKEELLTLNLANDIYRNPEDCARLIQLSRQSGRLREAEAVWRRKDGKPITVRINGRTLRDDRGELLGAEGIVENLTEWRELERQFRQAQKMEAVGRLAGGIAHDFNNLLTVISGHTEILSSLIEQDERPRRSVEQIGKAAGRAASLTRQLLAFSRMQILQPKVLDLNVVVAELSKMLPSLIGEDIGLIFAPEPKLGRVKADPGQIEQVIMNLAVNARDAMPQGGKLVIQTKNFAMDADYARTHPPAIPGQYAMLTVSDTGHGMDAETQSRIFEPFFTTKEQGKGTGLGLATVYGIVKQSGGFIWVYSEPGQGTRFEIYLPRVDEPIALAVPGNHGVANLAGSETLLLVEDQEDLRGLVGGFLRENGYTVLEARDGIEGLEVAEQHHGQIQLLVTDVVMPRMGGWELAERLLSLRPELKVLYLSGYSEYSVAHHVAKYRPGTLLEKPFPMVMLGRKVREILEQPN